MSTRFYLADERYMTEAEITDAEVFDESALICQKSTGPDGAIFTLEIPNIPFYNLRRESRVVNDNNNMEIEIVGISLMLREATAKTITSHHAKRDAELILAELGDARKWQKEWVDILPEQIPTSRSRVAEYARRRSDPKSV